MLELYVDTAVSEEAHRLLQSGIFRGVTTNPLLLARAGWRTDELPSLVRQLVESGAKQVFCQAWGEHASDLLARGQQLHDIDPRVVVKVPATREGTEAAAALTAHGIPVLLTAVYNASQAVLAAATGCAYVAPYLGRMGDAGRAAHQEVLDMHRILVGLDAPTRVLVASVRSPDDVTSLAREGIECFALSPRVADALFTDSLTEKAVAEFERAASSDEGT